MYTLRVCLKANKVSGYTLGIGRATIGGSSSRLTVNSKRATNAIKIVHTLNRFSQ